MANVPTVSWAETTPAGSDQINAGDNRIREMKTQIREVIDVDHDFPSSGQATDNGQHKRVTLQEQADLGSGAVGTTILGNQTVSGKGELVYTDEDDNDIQITASGKIHAPNLAGVYPAANVAAIANIMTLIYPVGSYYFNDSNSTNPGTLLGVGTWVAVEERVLVGYKSGSTEFGTAGGEYGAKTVTLDSTMIPAHTHSVSLYKDDGATWPGQSRVSKSYTETADGSTVTGSTGDGVAHNNCQPSRTVYIWRRTV